MYFWAPLILTLKNLCFSKYLILRIKAHRGSNKGSSPNIISQTIITTPSCMMMLFSNAFLVLQLQLATIYGDFWPRKTAERIKHLLHYWHICSADKLAKIRVYTILRCYTLYLRIRMYPFQYVSVFQDYIEEPFRGNWFKEMCIV